jgi:hypothetical protein
MPPTDELALKACTVLASDQPSTGEVCSRCENFILRHVAVFIWNDVPFWYCRQCREGMGL